MTTGPSPELIETALVALAIARAELGIDRRLDIYWHTGLIIGSDGQARTGGYDESSPDAIHLSATLTDPQEIIEVVRHEVCHAAGFSAARVGTLPAEVACAYFSVGGKPRLIDGRVWLPSGPVSLEGTIEAG